MNLRVCVKRSKVKVTTAWPNMLKIPFSVFVYAVPLVCIGGFLGPLPSLIVCLSVHPYVRTFIHPPTKSFSVLNEIWFAGRGRWVMHDGTGMPYSSIQGQGHVALKVRNSSILKIYLVRHFHWELSNGCWFFNLTISKFGVWCVT